MRPAEADGTQAIADALRLDDDPVVVFNGLRVYLDKSAPGGTLIFMNNQGQGFQWEIK